MTQGQAEDALPTDSPVDQDDDRAEATAGPAIQLVAEDTTEPGAGDEPQIEDPIHGEDGSFTFGAPAALRPVPVCLPRQAPRPIEHVADTEADWLDARDLSVRAVSARGHMHRYLGEVRQDSFAIGLVGNHLVVAVSDGVGSAENSYLGSAFLAHHAVGPRGVASTVLEAAARGAAADFSDLARLLAHEATRERMAPESVAATLIVAMIELSENGDGGREVIIAQIGDSTAWVVTPDGWECIGADTEGGDGPLSTSVSPMPHHTLATISRRTLHRSETLALVSDGVGNILSTNPSFCRELGFMWQRCAPTTANLLSVVDATVKSYDDDRTFVGVRFG